MLSDAATALASRNRLTCLCTCGAFLRFDWPAGLPYRGNRDPKPHDIAALTAAGEAAVRRVLTDDLIRRLKPRCAYLTLGVDTKQATSSKARGSFGQPHAELVCLVDMKTGSLHWTGKFWPVQRSGENDRPPSRLGQPFREPRRHAGSDSGLL